MNVLKFDGKQCVYIEQKYNMYCIWVYIFQELIYLRNKEFLILKVQFQKKVDEFFKELENKKVKGKLVFQNSLFRIFSFINV